MPSKSLFDTKKGPPVGERYNAFLRLLTCTLFHTKVSQYFRNKLRERHLPGNLLADYSVSNRSQQKEKDEGIALHLSKEFGRVEFRGRM